MANRSRTEYAVRLRAARKHAGLTQIELAAAVGMPQSTLSEAETTGQSSAYTPSIANRCGVDAEWLATGAGQMLSSTAWPFRKLTLAQLHHLEKLSPGALAQIEKSALGLLLLAQTPTLTAEKQIDTEAEDESALHEWESKKADSAGGIGDHASTDPEDQPGKRDKRPKGAAQAGRGR